MPQIKDGVILHGLYMEAFRWDLERQQITDATRGEMIATLPMLHMEPRQNYVVDPTQYISPLYKTAARAGVLSTTGEKKKRVSFEVYSQVELFRSFNKLCCYC